MSRTFRRLIVSAAVGAAIWLVPAFVIAVGFSNTGGMVVLGVGTLVTAVSLMRGVLLCLGTAVGLGLGLAAIALMPDAFYRPHERYALADRYVADVDAVERMPFGDLVAMGGAAVSDYAEPREVAFRTDARGFRNDRDLTDDALVIVGDSFIAGTSSTQEDLLSNRLSALLDRPVYAVGYPGDLAAYARQTAAIDRKAWLFAFEGNDFKESCDRDPETKSLRKRLTTRLQRAIPIFAKTRAYTVRARTSLRAALGDGSRDSSAKVVPAAVGDIPILFFREYIERSRHAGFRFADCAVAAIESVADQVEGIFFIPTKRRLYDGLIVPAPETELPHDNWAALRDLGRRTGIPVHDLTPAMRADAEAALAEDGSLLYWPDDTHWNGLGTSSAAREVARIIRARYTE